MSGRIRVLGIIPAKGGSTRLPRKNLRPLAGKSLVGWAAEVALACGLIDRLIVSTEDGEVADEARRYGVEVPFMRPDHLSRDPAGIVDVCLHALDELERTGASFDRLIIVPPTCPLRTANDICDAYALFERNDGKFLMSVAEYAHTPFAALELRGDGTLGPYFPSYIGKNTQRMPRALRCNGAFHILDVPAFRAARSYYGEPLLGYEMPRERSIDIDHEEELMVAEALLLRRHAVAGPTA